MSIKKRLLVVVDYQNDFITGPLGFKSALGIEERLIALIHEFNVSGGDIVFTQDVHDENYLASEEGKNLPVIHCQKGGFGAEIYGEVGRLAKGHRIFPKDTFGSKKLFAFLLAHEYDEVVLAGIITTMCVLANTIIAKTALPNAHIVVDRRGTASPDEHLEEEAYDVLKNIHVEVR